jgi:hypothetical protein
MPTVFGTELARTVYIKVGFVLQIGTVPHEHGQQLTIPDMGLVLDRATGGVGVAVHATLLRGRQTTGVHGHRTVT